MKKFVIIIILFLCSSFITNELSAQIAFSLNSEYKYLKGKDAAALSSTWYSPEFVDSGWLTGFAPFRYGDGAGGTLLSDMLNSYTTVYLRGTFEVVNAEFIDEITISADFDDGFIVWINGVFACSENAPSTPGYNSTSTDLREAGSLSTYVIPAPQLSLNEGINYIAVQGFNTTLQSSDFYLDFSITANTNLPPPPPLPRVPEIPVFSHKAGFYATPFTLTISSPSPIYNVAYTLDGSNPETSTTRFVAGTSVNILIDPLSNVGRPLTPGVIVRSSLLGANLDPSFPEGRTYLFESEIPIQTSPGGIWPSTNINGQIIDLPMDGKVVNDPRYASLIDFSLKDIPSLSVITDIKGLFDPVTGMYVNAMLDGEEWERDCSFELINADGSDGFQVNAGLRIRGGWSRHDDYPKHAFRLFFNSVYGDSKLNYPLFGDEGASKFDKIDLRCEQNYSWANAGSGGSPSYNTGVREVFSRDTQRDMGQPYTRSRNYHLYLNGMYWGLFQTQERSEANYAATYFGGSSDDYDVVKITTDGYVLEATDGNLNEWQNIYNLCNLGFTTNTNYYKLEGKDSNGKRIPGSPVLVDIDNLIDYMLIIFYSGNFDSPTSSFGGNQGPNNFYAIYNRKLKNEGFKFFAHDAEHTMMYEPVSPGTGLYEDRVNLVAVGGMNVSSFSKFHPQWLHEKLTANSEYRLRFADRANNYLRPGNVLSPEACLSRFDSRAAEIEYAIIAESARWGDSKYWPPIRTKDDTWLPEINKIRTLFIPARSAILIDQLKTAGLMPLLESARIKVNGEVTEVENYSFLNSVTIGFENPGTIGKIYYTIDNSDPRLPGGGINPAAVQWLTGNDFNLSNSAVIKTRVYNAGIWSALKYSNLLKTNEDFTNLKVTELMYHPKDLIIGVDTTFGTSLEFIEFKNTGTTPINISGMKLDSAVRCVFPANTILAPKEFFVAASKPAAFTDYYGFAPSGNFSGNFSNGGEYVLLTDPQGNQVLSFTYNDKVPWPLEADGGGYSLTSVVINPTGDPGLYTYWGSSSRQNGTPFADDGAVSNDPGARDINVNIYPNPASDFLTISLDTGRNNENVRIKIYSIGGILMYNAKYYSDNMISLKEYGIGPGVYLIRIEDQALFLTRKLIVNY